MRKLASIQEVHNIVEFEKANTCEVAQILGYDVLVTKGQFKAGDKVVYIENDSVPPDEKRFQFLWSKDELKPRPRRYYLKPKKFFDRTCLGVALPIHLFPEFAMTHTGYDVTDYLGVEKYEPTTPDNELKRYNFPSWIPKTDETRLQSEPSLLKEILNEPFVATIKYDGTSATYSLDHTNDTFIACSRNFIVQEGVYADIARELDIEKKLRQRKYNYYALQGEICGPKIGGNLLELSAPKLFVFNVFDLQKREYLKHNHALDVIHDLELEPVREFMVGTNFFEHDLNNITRMIESMTYEDTNNPIEGTVVRHLTNKFSRKLQGRLSFKIISNAFLTHKKGKQDANK